MKPRVYIDGKSGTTGIQIYDRLGSREDIELLLIDEELRHDPAERAKLMNQADVVFLCLPDAAAIEAVGLVTNPETRIIDTSTAHRVSPEWVYGFPELSGERRSAIASSKRVSNPGCHATGFISIVYPLVKLGIINSDVPVTAWSLTGYSGGGKKMINQYENEKTDDLYAPRHYGLNGMHKHIPEMKSLCALETAPIFNPIVDDYYKGMQVAVPLHAQFINGFTAEQIKDMLYTYYRNSAMVSVCETVADSGMISANQMSGKDSLTIYVCGNDERVTIVSVFDNLGKGASGAAVQNMNLMLGFKETEGLYK